jgi:hypothetical protein
VIGLSCDRLWHSRLRVPAHCISRHKAYAPGCRACCRWARPNLGRSRLDRWISGDRFALVALAHPRRLMLPRLEARVPSSDDDFDGRGRPLGSSRRQIAVARRPPSQAPACRSNRRNPSARKRLLAKASSASRALRASGLLECTIRRDYAAYCQALCESRVRVIRTTQPNRGRG